VSFRRLQGFRWTKYFAQDQRLPQRPLVPQLRPQGLAARRTRHCRFGSRRPDGFRLLNVGLRGGESHRRNGRDLHLGDRFSHGSRLWNGGLRVNRCRGWRDLASIMRGFLPPLFPCCGDYHAAWQGLHFRHRCRCRGALRWLGWRHAARRQSKRLHETAHSFFFALRSRQRLATSIRRRFRRLGIGAGILLTGGPLAHILHQPFAEEKQTDDNDAAEVHGQTALPNCY